MQRIRNGELGVPRGLREGSQRLQLGLRLLTVRINFGTTTRASLPESKDLTPRKGKAERGKRESVGSAVSAYHSEWYLQQHRPSLALPF